MPVDQIFAALLGTAAVWLSQDRRLAQRGLPVTPAKWNPATPLLGSLDGEAGITSKRLWAIVKRFFATTADVLADTNSTLAEKPRRATPHWMRHTHATHARCTVSRRRNSQQP